MKTLTTIFLAISGSLVLTSCSNDNESFQSEAETSGYQDIQIPMESLPTISAVAITGYPKMIKTFQNGILKYCVRILLTIKIY
ncbi:hypothetical protein ACS386_13820 [Flavobacteriaceae bacterium LMO-SS05]